MAWFTELGHITIILLIACSLISVGAILVIVGSVGMSTISHTASREAPAENTAPSFALIIQSLQS
jgi:hypothetical protein